MSGPTVTWITPEKGNASRRANASSSWRTTTCRSRRSGSSTATVRSVASGGTSRASTSYGGARPASEEAHIRSRPSLPTSAAARPRRARQFGSAASRLLDPGDEIRQAAARGWDDRRDRSRESLRQPLRRAPGRRVVGGARLSRQAGVGRLRARRLRRRERGAARGGPERALRGPGGRRRAGIAGRASARPRRSRTSTSTSSQRTRSRSSATRTSPLCTSRSARRRGSRRSTGTGSSEWGAPR